jgi:hypothetical protein
VQADADEARTAQGLLGDLLRQHRELHTLRNDLYTARRTHNVSRKDIESLRDLFNSDMVKYKAHELGFLRLVEQERQQAQLMNAASHKKITHATKLPADALKDWLVERGNQAREGNTLRRLYDQEDKVRAAARVAMRKCGLEHFEQEMKSVTTKINKTEQRYQQMIHRNEKLQQRFLVAADFVAGPVQAPEDTSGEQAVDVQPEPTQDEKHECSETWLDSALKRDEPVQITYNRLCGRLWNQNLAYDEAREKYRERLNKQLADSAGMGLTINQVKEAFAQEHLNKQIRLGAELDREESAFIDYREKVMKTGINPVR